MTANSSDEDILRYTHPLARFFPPGHKDSEWLLRLAIIRDDLQFEIAGLQLHDGADSDDIWRTSYFQRRACISLLEAHHILKYPASERAAQTAPARAVKGYVTRTVDFLEPYRRLFEQVRNAIGAHMRPNNAARNVPVFNVVMGKWPSLEGEAQVHFELQRLTSYRNITVNAILFALPEASGDDLEETLRQLSRVVLEGGNMVVDVIDALLHAHWVDAGIIKGTDEWDLALVDPKTRQARPL